MHEVLNIPWLCTMVVLVLSACWDYQTHRIPNFITFPALIIGLVTTPYFNSYAEIAPRLIFILILFVLGGLCIMGLGDIKLLMGVAAFQGVLATLIALTIAEVMIIMRQLIKNPKSGIEDIKTGLLVLNLRDASLIDKAKTVSFAPYLLTGFIGYTLGALLLI